MRNVPRLCLLSVLLLSLPVSLNASSSGEVTGFPGAVTVTYGPGGLPSVIDVEVEVGDGHAWTVQCRRDQMNLGRCSNLSASTKYRFTGSWQDHGLLSPASTSAVSSLTPSGARATLTGFSFGGQKILGASGAVATWWIYFDSEDGLQWALRCERAESNLNLCNRFEAGGRFEADGVLFAPSSMRPESVTSIP